MLGDRPFLREAFAWSVPATVRTGSLKLDGHATRGATAFLELASWLCPSFLKRPHDPGSGFPRLAARHRLGQVVFWK